jgi:hypothetical protein
MRILRLTHFAIILIVQVSTLLVVPALAESWAAASAGVNAPGAKPTPLDVRHIFVESERCIACHSNISTPEGQDISFGFQWRATMMALSARDPYWRAGVRREAIEHPTAIAAIEDKCSVCHMPTAHTMAIAQGKAPEIFGVLAASKTDPESTHLALDGVTCTTCHQIKADNFGKKDSFDGGYLIDFATPSGGRPVYGPFDVDIGRQRTMHTSTENFLPTQSEHIRQSELCATCHTLYTRALDASGKEVGELPEQMPYQEWLHSDYRNTHTCQACHMPVVNVDVPISATLGQKRSGVSQHVFVGGNAYMLRLMNRFRADLGVKALPQELEASALRTEQFLRTQTARLLVSTPSRSGSRASFDVTVQNISGHKFPTAYPSRRAWLHVTVKDSSGRVLFESGAQRADGSIAGNDNDSDALRFEPHYDVVRSSEEVQIYESMMVDTGNQPTTSLLSGQRYIKDNRLLPPGFDKTTASADIAVRGDAVADVSFGAGGDRVRYDIDVAVGTGPLQVQAELLFQSVGFRWAQNLAKFDAPEPKAFVSYYNSTAAQSAVQIAAAAATEN